jgi:tRNA A-37 threonylcarbamoyl transferase component Bud32
VGDSAKLHSDLEALIGSVLHDRYRVDSLLGAGGMGAVFKARHTGLERDVAIKVLHPEIGRDESVSKRFDREATSASRLDHPNCVRVTDFGTTDKGTKYLVMELLEGSELLDRLSEPWDPEAMIETAKQILAGLEHAHHFGIVHRDLKPENVFITKDFRGEELVKLVDFGIAKLIDEQGAEKLTRAGIVFGTPRYMSPEQAAGGKIDERTDLYAAGLIFYEMLAGRAPFETDDAAQLLRMQIMAPPSPLPDSVPAPLAAVVGKLLEKSKMDRYASAREVIDALDEAKAVIAAGDPTPAAAGAAAGLAAAGAAAPVTAPTGPLEVTSPTAPPTTPGATHPTAPSPAAANTSGASLATSSSPASTAEAGRSGAAWQPAATTPPVRSGATVASNAAASVDGPTTGRTLAYTSSGSHPTVPQSHGQTTGSHPGIGQPATGPFDSLAAPSPQMSDPAGAQAAWTGSHPALSGAQQQPVSGAYPSLASQPAMSAPVAPGSTSGYATIPEQPRRAWVPWVIAGVALILAVGAVSFAMTHDGDGDSQASSDAKEQPDTKANAELEQDGPEAGAATTEGVQAEGAEASAGAAGAAQPEAPAPGPTRSGKSIWSNLEREDAAAKDGGGASTKKKKQASGAGGSTSDAETTGEPDAAGDSARNDSSGSGGSQEPEPTSDTDTHITTEEEKRAEEQRQAEQRAKKEKGKGKGKGKSKDNVQ